MTYRSGSQPPKYIDRHGKPVRVGQRVRVRECIGRYGQCATREGIVKELSPYGGGTLELTEPATIYHRNHCERKNKGELAYVVIPRGGYEKFEDFEHGHETWIEILS